MTQSNYFYPLIIAIAVFIAYANALKNDFLWDDEFLIEKNNFITSTAYIPQILTQSSTAGFGGQDNFYRPTQTLYYLIIHSIAGKNKIAFHLGNILLHIANALLLFFLLLRLFKSKELSFATSLLWALHPTHTEAITYISGTADPMAFFFMLLSLLCFPYNRRSITLYIFSVLFFALTLVSKEAFIIGPGLLTLCLFITCKQPFYWKDYVKTLPFWLMSFTYLILRKTILNFDGTYQFYKTSNIYTENIIYRIYTFLAALSEYFKILFWPKDLHMERRFPVYTHLLSTRVLVGLGLIIFSFLLVYTLRKKKIFSFAWMWFFIAFVPMMGILIPVNSFILEHWLYLPSIGVFLMIGLLLTQASKFLHNAITPTMLIILGTSLAFATHQRNKDWINPITFYKNILKYNEGTARIHNNIAMAYSENDNIEKAKSHYLTAIDMNDTYPQTHYNLARIYVKENSLKKALYHLERSLKIKPDFIYSQKLRDDILLFIQKSRKPQ